MSGRKLPTANTSQQMSGRWWPNLALRPSQPDPGWTLKKPARSLPERSQPGPGQPIQGGPPSQNRAGNRVFSEKTAHFPGSQPDPSQIPPRSQIPARSQPGPPKHVKTAHFRTFRKNTKNPFRLVFLCGIGLNGPHIFAPKTH